MNRTNPNCDMDTYEKKYKEAKFKIGDIVTNKTGDKLKVNGIFYDKYDMLFDDGYSSVLPQHFVESNFYLAESEDERIRKALIFHYQGDGCICTNEYRIDFKDIRAWLEKRGEQKPVEWSEEDETIISNLISEIQNDKINPYNREGYCDWLESIKNKSYT